MSVLCALGSLLWFVTFVALTGILTGVSATFRLMEVTVTLVHPLLIFMLRLSNRLVLFGICLCARTTYHAYKRMCAKTPMQINLRAPEVRYTSNQLPNLEQETATPPGSPEDVASTSEEPAAETDDERTMAEIEEDEQADISRSSENF